MADVQAGSSILTTLRSLLPVICRDATQRHQPARYTKGDIEGRMAAHALVNTTQYRSVSRDTPSCIDTLLVFSPPHNAPVGSRI
jgi:hypothetical protein